MANQFLSFNVPANDGVGANLNVSAMDSVKTLVVSGAFTGRLILESSGDGINFSPVAELQNDQAVLTVEVVAQFMRIRRAQVSGGAVPTVMIGLSDGFTLQFFSVPVPATDGLGGVTAIATTGKRKTIQCVGDFAGGNILVEGSEDGVSFDPVVRFDGGNQSPVTLDNRLQSVRVRRAIGTAVVNPVVLLSAQDDPTGGGGTAQSILSFSEDEGRSNLGTESIVYEYNANFDILDALVTANISGIANRGAVAGTATANLRVGGTINGVDGTVRATATTINAADTQVTNTGAAFANPGGQQLVKVGLVHSGAQTANLRGLHATIG